MGSRDQSRHNLHHELQEGGQGHDVVHHTQHHNHHGTQQNALHLRIAPDIQEQQNAHHKADEDRQTSQPGNGHFVHPTLILGHINGAHLIGEGLDHRRHQKADDQSRQQCQQHIDEQLIFKWHVSVLRHRARKPTFL